MTVTSQPISESDSEPKSEVAVGSEPTPHWHGAPHTGRPHAVTEDTTRARARATYRRLL